MHRIPSVSLGKLNSHNVSEKPTKPGAAMVPAGMEVLGVVTQHAG